MRWNSTVRLLALLQAAPSVANVHAKHHFGVDRTLCLARLVDSGVARRDVKRCVQSCQQCSSIALHLHIMKKDP